jgi:hypothetical protein
MSDDTKKNLKSLGLFSFKNWSYKYKFAVLNESTLDVKFSFMLSRLNVFIVFALFSVFIVAFTILVIYLTPLKEYIPGYASMKDIQMIEENKMRLDSLQKIEHQKDLYIEYVLMPILGGGDLDDVDSSMLQKSSDIDYQSLTDEISEADSALRTEWENSARYDLIYFPDEGASLNIHQYLFYTPFKGTISNGFNTRERHYGVDIVGEKDQMVKATLEGTVLFSTWTHETGYTIAVQHNDDLISVYKHNSALLKEQGDHIKPGDPIAIVGNTGYLSTGPHLHFELWYRGNPVNPTEFISFE